MDNSTKVVSPSTPFLLSTTARPVEVSASNSNNHDIPNPSSNGNSHSMPPTGAMGRVLTLFTPNRQHSPNPEIPPNPNAESASSLDSRTPFIACRVPDIATSRHASCDETSDKASTRFDSVARQSVVTRLLTERVVDPASGNDPWRFVVILSYSILAISNSLQWVTFSPVPKEVSIFFHATIMEVNFLASVYLIVYAIAVVVSCKAFEAVGLKRSLTYAALLNLIGAGVKLMALYFYPRPPLLFVSQSINALSQVFIVAHPPTIAGLWFNDKHRTTANATMTAAQNIGIAIGVVMPTLFVPSGRKGGEGGKEHMHLLKVSFGRLFWVQLVIAVVSLGMMLCLFPKRPRYAASAMAAEAIKYDMRRSRAIRLRLQRRLIEKDLERQRAQQQQQHKQQRYEQVQREGVHQTVTPTPAVTEKVKREGTNTQTTTTATTTIMRVVVGVGPSFDANTTPPTQNSPKQCEVDILHRRLSSQQDDSPRVYGSACHAHDNGNDHRDATCEKWYDDVYRSADDEDDVYNAISEKERVRRTLMVAVAAAMAESSAALPSPEGRQTFIPPDDLDVMITQLEAKLCRLREAERACPSINVMEIVRISVRVLRESPSFSLMTAMSCLQLGVAWAMATVLPQVFAPLGISEGIAGWVGFVNLAVGGLTAPVVAPLIVGRDGNYKRALLGCGSLLLLDMSVMLLLITYFPHTSGEKDGLALVVVLFIGWGGVGGVLQNVMLPLLFELGVELTFPVSQTITATVTIWSGNAASFLLTEAFSYVLGADPTVSKALMSWCITVILTLVGALTLLAVYPHRFRAEYEKSREALQLMADGESEETVTTAETIESRSSKVRE